MSTVFLARRVAPILACAALVSLALAAPAHGQGVGFQGGVSVDPEQLYAGTHFETPELTPGLHLRAGVDGGGGNDVKTAAINVELLFKLDVGATWKLYQGGGPVVFIFRGGDPPENDVTGGLAGVFGLQHQSGFFFEFRAAGGRGPAFKAGVGFTYRGS
jgi:hypothetical protein